MAYKTWTHTPDAADALQTVLTVEPGKNHIMTHVLITNTDDADPVDVTIVMLDDADVQQGVLYSNTLAADAHENKRLNVPLPNGFKIAVKASVVDVASFVFVGEEFFTLGADKFPVDALADYAEKFTDTQYMDQAVNDVNEMNLLCSNPVTINAMAAHSTFWSKIASGGIMPLGKFFAGRAGLNPSSYADINAFMQDDTARPTLLEMPLTYKTQFDSQVALGKFLAIENGEMPTGYDNIEDWLNNASNYGQFLLDLLSNAEFIYEAVKDPAFMEAIAGIPFWMGDPNIKDNIDIAALTTAIEDVASSDSRITMTNKGDYSSQDVDLEGGILLIDMIKNEYSVTNSQKCLPEYEGNLTFTTMYGGEELHDVVIWGPCSFVDDDNDLHLYNVRVIELA